MLLEKKKIDSLRQRERTPPEQQSVPRAQVANGIRTSPQILWCQHVDPSISFVQEARQETGRKGIGSQEGPPPWYWARSTPPPPALGQDLEHWRPRLPSANGGRRPVGSGRWETKLWTL